MAKLIQPKEEEILNLTLEIWNKWLEMESQHPDERRVISDCIHQIQAMVANRMIQRAMPEIYNKMI